MTLGCEVNYSVEPFGEQIVNEWVVLDRAIYVTVILEASQVLGFL
jgi:hypothetical protein